jgi:hypothetical protein
LQPPQRSLQIFWLQCPRFPAWSLSIYTWRLDSIPGRSFRCRLEWGSIKCPLYISVFQTFSTRRPPP